MDPHLLDRYLGLLGLSRTAPDLNALCRLVQAHLCRVPFENISKLYLRDRLGLMNIPSLELFLDGIERFHFGGTCYAHGYYFYQLLASLGFQVMLCGADMANPDVHAVIMATVEDREYLVDVGYAAPLVAPLPRDLPVDHSISFGRDRYVLKPQDASRRSRLEFYKDGRFKHAYVAKREPRTLPDFATAIRDSYRPEATFMNALLLARFCPERSIVIHNLSVLEVQGNVTRSRSLTDRAELVEAIRDHFGIPPEISHQVVHALDPRGDAWA